MNDQEKYIAAAEALGHLTERIDRLCVRVLDLEALVAAIHEEERPERRSPE